MKLQCTITFISDLQFEQVVYPQTIEIFEVYHPGAVVRILACDSYSGSDKSRFVVMYQWSLIKTGYLCILEFYCMFLSRKNRHFVNAYRTL